VRWLYATGLRLSEMANAQCGDLQKVDYQLPDGKEDIGWLLSVLGKGDKRRQVPVPQRLVDELQLELERHGLEPDVRAESNHDVAILTRFEGGVQRRDTALRIRAGQGAKGGPRVGQGDQGVARGVCR
jgi:integrase